MRNIISGSIVGGLDDKKAKAAGIHEKRGIVAGLDLIL